MCYRKSLAKDNTKKVVWTATVLALSIITLCVSVKNIGLLRELVVFILAIIQAIAAITILVTFLWLRNLTLEYQNLLEKRMIISQVQPTL